MRYIVSDVRMLVRGHVERGEERQADDVGYCADQLGTPVAAGPAAADDAPHPAAQFTTTYGDTF